MAKLVVRRFDEPDEVFEAEGVTSQTVDLGDARIGRTTHQPGWRWSTHVKPHVGTEWCMARHTGVVISGKLHAQLTDGTEMTAGPGDAYAVPPGHDGWVDGDEPLVVIEWTGVDEWLRPADSRRVLATVLFTDIVDSTGHIARLGDARWRTLLAENDDAVRAIVARLGGREVDHTGDGFFLLFDGAARAVRAGALIRDAAHRLGLEIRAAAHAGEVEFAGAAVRGVVVHAASRILGAAAPGQILVSEVTRQLATGAGLSFGHGRTERLRGLAEAVVVYPFEGPAAGGPERALVGYDQPDGGEKA